MKPIQLYAAGIVLAAVPAVVGLTGNASFSQSVPVRSPEVASSSDRPAPKAAPTHDANDDHGRRHGGRGADDGPNHDANDDHGRDSGSRHSGRDDGGHHAGGDDGRHHSDAGGSGGHGSDD